MHKFVSVSHLDVKQKLQTWKMTWKHHRPMLWKQLLKQITFNYLFITFVHVYVFYLSQTAKHNCMFKKVERCFSDPSFANIFQSRCHFYKVRCCLFPLQRQGAWGKWWPQGSLRNHPLHMAKESFVSPLSPSSPPQKKKSFQKKRASEFLMFFLVYQNPSTSDFRPQQLEKCHHLPCFVAKARWCFREKWIYQLLPPIILL